MTWLVGISYQDTQGSLVQTDIHTQGHESKIMVHDDPEGELATEIAYFLNNKLSSQPCYQTGVPSKKLATGYVSQ